MREESTSETSEDPVVRDEESPEEAIPIPEVRVPLILLCELDADLI